jgi:hypothetical protein
MNVVDDYKRVRNQNELAAGVSDRLGSMTKVRIEGISMSSGGSRETRDHVYAWVLCGESDSKLSAILIQRTS